MTKSQRIHANTCIQAARQEPQGVQSDIAYENPQGGAAGGEKEAVKTTGLDTSFATEEGPKPSITPPDSKLLVKCIADDVSLKEVVHPSRGS